MRGKKATEKEREKNATPLLFQVLITFTFKSNEIDLLIFSRVN